MKTVCILFGGVSPEHEVSCASAQSILENIDRSLYKPEAVGITKRGEWLLTACETDEIGSGAWQTHSDSVRTVFSPGRGEISGFYINGRWLRPDCVFPVLHGENGEDGSVQGLCRLADIPCVGSGVAASAICMDKAFTKQLCALRGIAQCEWLGFSEADLQAEDGTVKRVEEKFSYPVFVKPANTGSSVGVSKAYGREELKKAIALAARFDKKVLVEEFVDGLELEIGVLGNVSPVVSGVGQILPSRDFYSYESKYIDGTSEQNFEPDIGAEAKEEVRRTALEVYSLLGCRGLARVDFFFRKADGKVIFNEINTLPGFTKISMYPKLFERAGISYSELITKLIEFAAEE